MLSSKCWLIVVLLACAVSACDSVSRVLAGMDDPANFTWERSGDAVTEKPAPLPATTTQETRQRRPGLLGEDALVPPVAPVPVEPAAPSTSLTQDLRDCEAPDLRAGAERNHSDAPTIERSENSSIVARCMTEKGYRKVYLPRSEMF